AGYARMWQEHDGAVTGMVVRNAPCARTRPCVRARMVVAHSRGSARGTVPQAAGALSDFRRGAVDAPPGGDGDVLGVASGVERAHARVLEAAGDADGVVAAVLG